MSGGGSTKQVQTTQDQSPWSPQQPFLMQGFEEARRLYGSPEPQYYPGQTVADTSQFTSQGQNAGMRAAEQNANFNARTVGGDFLSAGNPYFQGMMTNLGNAMRPSIDSAFAGAGRGGSGAHANAFASALADQGGRLAYQNYGDERARQIAASQNYSPYQFMMGVGQQQEDKQREYLGDAAARWDFAQNQPQQKLEQFMNLVGNRSYGGQSVSSQPYTQNSTMQGIGTGIAGLGALGQFGQAVPGLMKLFG
jgi:hypothetical protein